MPLFLTSDVLVEILSESDLRVLPASDPGNGNPYLLPDGTLRVDSGSPTLPGPTVESGKFWMTDGLGGTVYGEPALLDAEAIEDALGYLAADDAEVVHLAGTETITGAKRFNSQIDLNGYAKLGGVSAGIAGLYAADGVTLGLLKTDSVEFGPNFANGSSRIYGSGGYARMEVYQSSGAVWHNVVRGNYSGTVSIGSATNAVATLLAGPTVYIGSGVASDTALIRESAGLLRIGGDAGLRVRNLLNTADAAVTAGAGTFSDTLTINAAGNGLMAYGAYHALHRNGLRAFELSSAGLVSRNGYGLGFSTGTGTVESYLYPTTTPGLVKLTQTDGTTLGTLQVAQLQAINPTLPLQSFNFTIDESGVGLLKHGSTSRLQATGSSTAILGGNATVIAGDDIAYMGVTIGGMKAGFIDPYYVNNRFAVRNSSNVDVFTVANSGASTTTSASGTANLTLVNGGEAELRLDASLAGAHVWGMKHSAGSLYFQHATTRPFGGTIISPLIIGPTGDATFSGQIDLNGHAKLGGVSAGIAGLYANDGATLGTLRAAVVDNPGATLTLGNSSYGVTTPGDIKWGATSAYPMLRRNGINLEVRYADGSALSPLVTGPLAASGTSFDVATFNTILNMDSLASVKSAVRLNTSIVMRPSRIAQGFYNVSSLSGSTVAGGTYFGYSGLVTDSNATMAGTAVNFIGAITSSGAAGMAATIGYRTNVSSSVGVISSYVGFEVVSPVVSGTGSITSAVGLKVNNLTTAGTNIAIQTGAGYVLLGASTPVGTDLLQVTGAASFSGKIGLNGYAKLGGISAGIAGLYANDGVTLGTLNVHNLSAAAAVFNKSTFVADAVYISCQQAGVQEASLQTGIIAGYGGTLTLSAAGSTYIAMRANGGYPRLDVTGTFGIYSGGGNLVFGGTYVSLVYSSNEYQRHESGTLKLRGDISQSYAAGVDSPSARFVMTATGKRVAAVGDGAGVWASTVRETYIASAPAKVETSVLQMSGDPGTIDVQDGFHTMVKNTTSGEIRGWMNNGGVMYKSAAYTT